MAGTLTAKNSSTVTVKETLSGLGSLAIEDDSAVVLDSAVIDPSVDPDELKQYAEKEDKEKIKADGSTAVSVTLHKISTYTLSVTAPEFEPVTLGYKQPDPKGITITSSDGSSNQRITYSYDDGGALAEIRTYNAEGEIISREFHENNEDGNPISIKEYAVTKKFGETVNELKSMTTYSYTKE